MLSTGSASKPRSAGSPGLHNAHRVRMVVDGADALDLRGELLVQRRQGAAAAASETAAIARAVITESDDSSMPERKPNTNR